MSGLTVITPRGTVEVPQHIEALGGDAIDRYVEEQLTAAIEAFAAQELGSSLLIPAPESPENPPTPAEGAES